ncbi:hypothetical protein [uncultured Ruthenibacterium sp.]|uniref:hypothetical protein n=1 Tax=uncultured Ruthenibacterium sp. TaxID=1905347 RepID=UPI00349E7325
MHSFDIRKRLSGFWMAESPARWELIVAGILVLFCYLFFNHPDIVETANHSWLFLDHLFSGDLLNFYDNVLAHENTFYYVNGAHYNVILYLLFGLWLLPVYGIYHLFSLDASAKLLACIAALGCAFMTRRLALRLDISEGRTKYMRLAFLVSPLTLAGVFCMGQYDSLCLFFLLWALYFYFEGRLSLFTLLVGVAMVCKFFALLVFLPLLLLREKRLSRLCGYGALSLWLMVPTSLLFSGRDGDMGFFNELMIERLFNDTIPGAHTDVPLFFLMYALVLVFCFFWNTSESSHMRRMAVYICMTVFALLFSFVLWHPQWLVLLVPFAILSVGTAQNRTPWYAMNAICCAGALLLCYQTFPGQLEVGMMDYSFLHQALGLSAALAPHQNLTFYFGLLPYVNQLAPVMFAAPLLAAIIFLYPRATGTLGDQLSHNKLFAPSIRAGVWTGACVFGALLLVPVAFQWYKCFL